MRNDLSDTTVFVVRAQAIKDVLHPNGGAMAKYVSESNVILRSGTENRHVLSGADVILCTQSGHFLGQVHDPGQGVSGWAALEITLPYDSVNTRPSYRVTKAHDDPLFHCAFLGVGHHWTGLDRENGLNKAAWSSSL